MTQKQLPPLLCTTGQKQMNITSLLSEELPKAASGEHLHTASLTALSGAAVLTRRRAWNQRTRAKALCFREGNPYASQLPCGKTYLQYVNVPEVISLDVNSTRHGYLHMNHQAVLLILPFLLHINVECFHSYTVGGEYTIYMLPIFWLVNIFHHHFFFSSRGKECHKTFCIDYALFFHNGNYCTCIPNLRKIHQNT